MHHLVPQGLGLDVASFVDTFCHLIDLIGMRACCIDDHRCIDLSPILKSYSQHLVVLAANFDDLGVKHEFTAFGFGSSHDIMDG